MDVEGAYSGSRNAVILTFPILYYSDTLLSRFRDYSKDNITI